MKALQIQDINDFMQKLLTPGVFDTFELVRMTIKTYAVFTIDGAYLSSWADSTDLDDASDSGSARYTQWKQFLPIVRSVIQGKKKPSSLQIVFRLADYNAQKITDSLGDQYHLSDIDGLYLNITYQHNNDKESLLCTTGTSLRIFSLDKTIEHTWDEMVGKLFKARQIPFLQQ